jgi:hypothetical protein
VISSAIQDGFMSLFQTRLILNGIADAKTLESISLAIGEYDRELVSSSTKRSEKSDEWFGHTTAATTSATKPTAELNGFPTQTTAPQASAPATPGGSERESTVSRRTRCSDPVFASRCLRHST